MKSTLIEFGRSFGISALFLLVIPVIGMLFAPHGIDRLNAQARRGIEGAIIAEIRSPTERQNIIDFYRAHRASEICASDTPDLAVSRQNLADTCQDMLFFEAIHFASKASLLIGVLTTLLAGLSALLSFFSRGMQYKSFVFGWNMLRITSALQALLQGFVVTMLSYWMTALWFHSYWPQLILVVGACAIGAAWFSTKALFHRPSYTSYVAGEALDARQAPALWARIDRLARAIGTAPPDQILVSVDDNFFVTEAKIEIGGRDGIPQKEYQGRTLCLGISLLGILSRGQADAVFAHELAHFQGGDTEFSSRLSPALRGYQQYLQALYEGGFTLPLFHFMAAFRELFQLSIARSAREREFSADRVAVSQSSADETADALLKIVAYGSYRDRIEGNLFAHHETHDDLDISAQMRDGFAEYVESKALVRALDRGIAPHPFDSHPKLAARLEAIGLSVGKHEYAERLVAPVKQTWLDEIEDASTIEANLWEDYESVFASNHERSLAYRYLPASEEEHALVEKFFPAISYGREGKLEAIALDFERLSVPEWGAPLELHKILKAQVRDGDFQRSFIVNFEGGVEHRLNIKKLDVKPDLFVQEFSAYWSRSVQSRKFVQAQVERALREEDKTNHD